MGRRRQKEGELPAPIHDMVIGELLAVVAGSAPLVRQPGGRALRANTEVDLSGPEIATPLVLCPSEASQRARPCCAR